MNDTEPEKDQTAAADRALRAIGKDFVIVGKTSVRVWHLWLATGILAGAVAGVLAVANRSGEFDPSEAAASCGNSPTCTVNFPTAGVTTVSVTAKDALGKKVTATQAVIVGEAGGGTTAPPP